MRAHLSTRYIGLPAKEYSVRNFSKGKIYMKFPHTSAEQWRLSGNEEGGEDVF